MTGQWTIVAEDLPLSRRDFVLDGVSRPLDTPCPLCEGRELTAGHEIAAVRNGSAPDGPGWQLRVVPNRVPALRVEAGMSGAHDGLFIHRPGLGAHEVVISTDAAQMQAQAGSFDFILDAVSASHDINAYLNLLKHDGNLVLVGAPEKPLPVAAFPLIFRRRSFSGSLIGGLPETQEMLDFCGKHNITCDIEMIRMDQINDAYERMLKSDVKYRFVIDMASLV